MVRWYLSGVANERVRSDYARMSKVYVLAQLQPVLIPSHAYSRIGIRRTEIRQEMLHSAQEIMPFMFLNETVALEIARLKRSEMPSSLILVALLCFSRESHVLSEVA